MTYGIADPEALMPAERSSSTIQGTALFLLKPDSHAAHLSSASQWRLPAYSSDLTFGQHTAIVFESEEILQTEIVS